MNPSESEPSGQEAQPSQPSPQSPAGAERQPAGPAGPGARLINTGYVPPPPAYQPQPYPPGYPVPGPMMGPVPFGPYPMPPRKRSALRTFFTVVAVVALGFSLLLNFILLVTLSATLVGDEHSVQSTLVRGSGGSKVIVLPVEGMISDRTAELMGKWLDSAQNDPDVRAVILAVDTPGGAVTASDVIHARLQRFRREKGVPVVVTMGALATSGGYYISAHADYIIAQPTTLTGNIGVLWPRLNFSELLNKWGISENTLSSPRDGFKNAGSSLRPESPEETAYLQGIIDEMYARFRDIVKDGRGSRLKGDISRIANGQIFTAGQALNDHGLIDEIGDMSSALSYLSQVHGIRNPTVVRYQRRLGFLDALTGVSSSEAASLKVHGIEVKVDAQTLHELTTPRPLYLWRGD